MLHFELHTSLLSSRSAGIPRVITSFHILGKQWPGFRCFLYK